MPLWKGEDFADPVFDASIDLDLASLGVTAERVRGLFVSRRPASVARYDLPRLHAFNFVLDAVLEGGVNASLGLDGHGKSLSFLLLAATVRIERGSGRASGAGGVTAPPAAG